MTHRYVDNSWHLNDDPDYYRNKSSYDRETRNWYNPNTQKSTTHDLTSYYIEPTEVIDFAEVCLMGVVETSRVERCRELYASEDFSEQEDASRQPFRLKNVSDIRRDESFISESCAEESVVDCEQHYIEHISDTDSINQEDLTTDDDDDDDASFDSNESETENGEEESLLDKLLDGELLDGDFAMIPLEPLMAPIISNVYRNFQDEFDTYETHDHRQRSVDGSRLATSQVLVHDRDPFESRRSCENTSSSSSTVSSTPSVSSSNSTSRNLLNDHHHPKTTDADFSISTDHQRNTEYSSARLSYRHDDQVDVDAVQLLERAHERLERQSLQDTVEFLREKLTMKNDEIECLNDQLRRAVYTKCDLVMAQADLEQCHDTEISKRRIDVKELKQQNYTLLEEYSMKEKELLTELLTLTHTLKDVQIRHRDEMDDKERLHRNQILEKDYQIAQLTVELQTAKMKYETFKQDHMNGLYDSGVHKQQQPRRKTTIKKIFHTQ